MRSIFLIMISVWFFLYSSNGQSNYPNGVSDCIARWDFSSPGSFTTLPDVSGNGHTGIPQNILACPGWRNQPNRAGIFNGTNSKAVVTSSNLLNPNSYTIIALVKINDFYSGTCNATQIISKGYPYYVQGQYGLYIHDNYFDNSCNVFSPNNMQLTAQAYNQFSGPFTGNFIQKNRWYFLAATYGQGQMKLFQVEMDTAVKLCNISPMHVSANNGPLGSNSQDLTIGWHENPPYPYWLNGSVDEVALFNRALTDSEIFEVYEYLWDGPTPGLNISIYPSDTICFGTTVTVKTTGLNNISWSGGIVNNVPFMPTATSNYSVTGTDIYGCPRTSSITIVVNPIPDLSVSIVPNDTICEGSSIIFNASGCLSYQFSNGVNNGIPFFPANSSAYSIVGKGGNGCTDTANLHITVLKPPFISISVQPESTICPGEQVTLSATSNGVVDWSNGITNNLPFTPITSSVYTATATDSNGCTSSVTTSISIQCGCKVSVPNAFSPNGDSQNDHLHILTSAPIELINFVILNRWGEVIFQSIKPEIGWEGNFKGIPCDIGAYYYFLKYRCPEKNEVLFKAGDINLIR